MATINDPPRPHSPYDPTVRAPAAPGPAPHRPSSMGIHIAWFLLLVAAAVGAYLLGRNRGTQSEEPRKTAHSPPPARTTGPTDLTLPPQTPPIALAEDPAPTQPPVSAADEARRDAWRKVLEADREPKVRQETELEHTQRQIQEVEAKRQALLPNQNEARAAAALRELVTTENKWCSGDLDGNKIQDYWVGDLAGLYLLQAYARDQPTWVSKELAQADVVGVARHPDISPAGPVPYQGYYFCAVEQDPLGTLYAPPDAPPSTANRNPKAFAFCAYPSEHGVTGTNTYLVSESGLVWFKDLGPKATGVGRFPAEPEKDGWLPFR